MTNNNLTCIEDRCAQKNSCAVPKYFYEKGAKDFAKWLVEDSNICDVTCDGYVDVDSIDYSINKVIKIWKEQLKEETENV